MMKRPNFVCVGAGKSGTTAMFHYLGQHPDVFLPAQKELNLFAWPDLAEFNNGPGTQRSRDDWVKTLDQYDQLFRKADKGVVLDFSPTYLHAPGAPKWMSEALDNPKILIMLRNPVEKVFSQYMHLKRDARETLSLEDALAAEDRRIAEKWGAIFHYVATSKYAPWVQGYMDVFGRDNVHIILFDDFKKNAHQEVRAVFNFLGLRDDIPLSDAIKKNQSGLPKSKLLARAIGPNIITSFAKSVMPRELGVKIKGRLMQANLGGKGAMDETIRASLQQRFQGDIAALETLIGRSTGWLAP